MVTNSDRHHQPAARFRPIARHEINMFRVKAKWTMIAVAAVGHWKNLFAALLALKTLIFRIP